ncbi:MAG: hypothetical protein P4N60_24825 [Verrucomicrobiae bacterium]|nr:hypothetical protein [Verrucomicrobiae bacterium]
MDITTHNPARPLAVKLALAWLGFGAGVAFVLTIAHFESSHYLIYGSILVQHLLYFVLLWFAFHGKNWARWVLVV